MDDPVRHAAQRDDRTIGKRRRFREPPEPGCDPAAVLLREARALPSASRAAEW